MFFSQYFSPHLRSVHQTLGYVKLPHFPRAHRDYPGLIASNRVSQDESHESWIQHWSRQLAMVIWGLMSSDVGLTCWAQNPPACQSPTSKVVRRPRTTTEVASSATSGMPVLSSNEGAHFIRRIVSQNFVYIRPGYGHLSIIMHCDYTHQSGKKNKKKILEVIVYVLQ